MKLMFSLRMYACSHPDPNNVAHGQCSFGVGRGLIATGRMSVDKALAVCYDFRSEGGGSNLYAADHCKQGAVTQYVEMEAGRLQSFTRDAANRFGALPPAITRNERMYSRIPSLCIAYCSSPTALKVFMSRSDELSGLICGRRLQRKSTMFRKVTLA